MAEIMLSYTGPNLTESSVIREINLGSIPDNTGAPCDIKLEAGQQIGFQADGDPLILPEDTTLIARIVYSMIERKQVLVRFVPEKGFGRKRAEVLSLFSQYPYADDHELGRTYIIPFDLKSGIGEIDLNEYNKLAYHVSQLI